MSGSPRAAVPADRRTRLSPDDRRAQLLALGVEALADHELDDLTIEEFSARAGVSRALFSHYFGSRAGFHRAVLETATSSMLAATTPDESLSPAERLTDTLLRTVAFVRAHRGIFFSLVRGPASGDPRSRELVEAARVAQTDRVLALFAEAGIAASPVLRIVVRSWVAFVEQTLVDAALGSDLAAEQIVVLLVECLQAVTERTQPGSARALAEQEESG
ncbi:TetR/AcrR family transcriptional regulator [Microbacterium sp. NPDC091313]